MRLRTEKQGDFTKQPFPAAAQRYNLILTNPPYVRHHHVGREEKLALQRAVAQGPKTAPERDKSPKPHAEKRPPVDKRVRGHKDQADRRTIIG